MEAPSCLVWIFEFYLFITTKLLKLFLLVSSCFFLFLLLFFFFKIKGMVEDLNFLERVIKSVSHCYDRPQVEVHLLRVNLVRSTALDDSVLSSNLFFFCPSSSFSVLLLLLLFSFWKHFLRERTKKD